MKIKTLITLLFISTPLHAAVYNLSGSFSSSLAVSNLGSSGGNGGTISGTLDTDTNLLTIAIDGPATGTSLRGLPVMTISPITLRLGPAPINLEVDTDGTNPADSPLLLELTTTNTSGTNPQSSDMAVSISDTLETQIISGLAYATIDGDDGDTAGLVVATIVPEPSSALLIGVGALGFMVRRKRN